MFTFAMLMLICHITNWGTRQDPDPAGRVGVRLSTGIAVMRAQPKRPTKECKAPRALWVVRVYHRGMMVRAVLRKLPVGSKYPLTW